MDEEAASQNALIAPFLETQMEVGDTWYAVELRWWRGFGSYVGLPGLGAGLPQQPGPIDNSSLQGSVMGTLSKDMSLDMDFKMVPEGAWKLLCEWYGGSPEFGRKVILRGADPSFELFPQPCEAKCTDAAGAPCFPGALLLASRKVVASDLLAQLGAALKVKAGVVSRLWFKPSDSEEYVLVNPTQSVDDLFANDDVSTFLVEAQTTPGVWPRAATAFAGASGVAGAPPASIFPPPVTDLVAWRAGLKKDDYIDAQDSEMKWYDSRIVDFEPGFSTATHLPDIFKGTAEDKLRVHFMGWESRFDMWYMRSSIRMQPVFTKTRNWRDFRVNDKMEMRVNARWFAGNVEEVDRTEFKIKVRPVEKLARSTIGDKWFPFWSDDISDAKVHIRSMDINDYYASSSSSYYARGHTKGTPAAAGVVGLNNLGNTCFMASMLQCLSNSEPLTRYFLDDRHGADINKDNPLGCGGHLAEAYGQLLKDMWSGDFTCVSPTEFKHQIGKKAPQFQGYQQQDSQELMSFLMDGLNEDLNRVLKKPFVETVESDGRPDPVVAGLSWANFKLRNDSVVSDVFAGQLRSHVKCNVCDRESTTFDPYLSLSVPVPTKQTKSFVFQAMPLGGGTPIRYKAEVNAVGCIMDVMVWYSGATGIPVRELLVGNVFSHAIHKFMSPGDALSDVYRTDSVWFYRVPESEGAEEVKAERKKAAAAVLAKARLTYGPHYVPYGHAVDNEADVIICMTGRTVARRYQYSTQVTQVAEYCAEPFVAPLSHLSGSYSTAPTGQQFHNFIWTHMRGLVKPEAADKYAGDVRPYQVYVVRKSASPAYHYSASPVLENNDTVVDTTEKLLYIHWTVEGAADFNEEAGEAVELHESLTVVGRKDDALTLYKSFEKFNDEEQLGEMDMWYCSKCKEHRRAFKRMGLWKLPEVLVVHLKRFQYSQGAYFTHREKIEALVHFPITGLDLSPYTLGEQEVPPVYDLFAVSNHMGGMGGGHYTAYAKNFITGRWYNFDDSSASPVDPARVISPNAYVLFYRRRAAGAVLPEDPTSAVAAPRGGDADDVDSDADDVDADVEQ